MMKNKKGSILDDGISDEKFLKLSMLEKNLGPKMGKHGEALLRRIGRSASIAVRKREDQEYRKLDEKIANKNNKDKK